MDELLIIYQRENGFIKYSAVAEVSAGEETVFVTPTGGKAIQAAKYKNREQGKFAVMLLKNSILENVSQFRFPTIEEIEGMMDIAKSHSSHFRTKRNNHGGS